ncbi:MAG TPA: HEAT repeat domain-containing protein [Gemmataceae bacterium]|nr:HEAT repeat domain-containing protein [Gemmataceae bacterium]
MRRVVIFATALVCLSPIGLASAQDKKEEKVLGKTISEWITILRTHENERFRQAALKALEVGNEAHRSGRDALIDALEKDKSVRVRREAVEVIGRIGPDDFKPGMKVLVKVLHEDKSDEVREAAALVIASDRFKVPAQQYVSDLADALKDPHVGTRIAIAGALRTLGERASPAFPTLFTAAKNPKEALQVRIAAVQTLARHAKGDPMTLPMLLDLAGPENPAGLREVAIDGLGRNGSDSEAIPTLLAKGLEEKNLELRKASAVALSMLGERAKPAWPAIKEHVADKKEDSAIRNHLIRVAGTLGKTNAEAIASLTAAAKADESTENRIAAIQELGALGTLAKTAAASLTEIAAQDPRAAVREAATKAVKQINP